jgi:DNA-binding transcriptional ArsR family regulator
MDLVEAKLKILEKLWEDQQPMRARDVAQKLNLRVAAVTMHLLRLRKLGYVQQPKYGYYAITDLGKETIGLPKIDKAYAAKILSTVPYDKAFQFYNSMHQYTHVLANSLLDFGDKLQKIDVKSVEFHVPRKDFEQWVQSLGDVELAKRFGLICSMHLHGQELRTKVYETVKHRLEELRNIHG